MIRIKFMNWIKLSSNDEGNEKNEEQKNETELLPEWAITDTHREWMAFGHTNISLKSKGAKEQNNINNEMKSKKEKKPEKDCQNKYSLHHDCFSRNCRS